MKSLDEGATARTGHVRRSVPVARERTVIESLMLNIRRRELQPFWQTSKVARRSRPLRGGHVSRIITDLEEHASAYHGALMRHDARRRAICDSAGVDDAKEYNSVRARMRARGQTRCRCSWWSSTSSYEWFSASRRRSIPTRSIRQGRAYWIHLMVASRNHRAEPKSLGGEHALQRKRTAERRRRR